jgi:hypothetical protein
LPYLGEQKIYSQYDWERDWFHPNNQALASKRLDLLLCPSTPNPDRPLTGEISGTAYKVAAADYVATHGFTDALIPAVFPPGTVRLGALPLDEKRKRCEINLPAPAVRRPGRKVANSRCSIEPPCERRQANSFTTACSWPPVWMQPPPRHPLRRISCPAIAREIDRPRPAPRFCKHSLK